MRQRDVEHQGLELLLLARTLREDAEVAHYLQAVGYLDDRHTRVGAVLDYQFFVVLGLQARVLGLDGADLVQTVHQSEHVFREGGQVHLRMRASGFVEIHGGDAFLRQTDFVADYSRHSVGMRDEGHAIVAHLTAEGLQRDFPRSADKIFHYFFIWRASSAF